MSRVEQRRDKLRKLLRKQGVEGMLVTDFTNVTYLTGFTGDDSYLLLTGDAALLISDSRFDEQLREECPELDVTIRGSGVSMLEAVAKAVASSKTSRLGIESESMTVGLRDRLSSRLEKVTLVGTEGLVEQLREIKDREEVAEIRQAVEYAERAFAVVRAALRSEQTEKEVADGLEHQIRLFGGVRCSFPPIVAVGPRAALPHATPTDRRIGDSPFVLIDWGAQGRLYVSDLTRVLVTAKIPPKLERIYEVVLKAQRQAIAAIQPGAVMQDIDAAARKVIEQAGYGKRFGHSLGHGIGLKVHEAPRLAARQDRPLQAGMVVTVEPGIYLPGFGGVRLEDDVLVTRSGHEVLSSVPKELADSVIGT